MFIPMSVLTVFLCHVAPTSVYFPWAIGVVTFSGYRLTIRYEMKCRSCILRFSFYCQLVWPDCPAGQHGAVRTAVESLKHEGHMASNVSNATLIEMANPRPSNLWVSFLKVLMPMTRPWAVTKGPPLLPG